jgi:hypothetical protein
VTAVCCFLEPLRQLLGVDGEEDMGVSGPRPPTLPLLWESGVRCPRPAPVGELLEPVRTNWGVSGGLFGGDLVDSSLVVSEELVLPLSL